MLPGKAHYEPRDRLTHVHFTTTAVISLFYIMGDGGSAEIAIVGIAPFTG